MTNDYYTLWTLQPQAVLDILQEKGVVRADGRRADRWFQQDGSYQWMRDQFKLLRGGKGRTQLWAWQNPKPDLRYWGWYTDQGETDYRIEFRIPKDKVLLSDYDAWHMVLNKHWVSLSRAEYEAFEAEEDELHASLIASGVANKGTVYNTVRETFKERTAATWPRIFDLEAMAKLMEDPWYGGKNPGPLWVQAVFEELRLEWVTKITPYKGRRKP